MTVPTVNPVKLRFQCSLEPLTLQLHTSTRKEAQHEKQASLVGNFSACRWTHLLHHRTRPFVQVTSNLNDSGQSELAAPQGQRGCCPIAYGVRKNLSWKAGPAITTLESEIVICLQDHKAISVLFKHCVHHRLEGDVNEERVDLDHLLCRVIHIESCSKYAICSIDQ